MAQTAEKIRRVSGNAIDVTIDRLVGEQRDPSLREAYRKRICDACGISNRYSMLLNNTVVATVQELATVAQVLGVPVQVLIMLED